MTSAASQPAPAPAATPPEQEGKPPSFAWRILRIFLYQRELTPLVILIGLFIYFALRAGSNFTGLESLSSAAGYAGPIGAIAVGQVLLLVLAEIDLSAGQIFLFCPWVEYWLHTNGLPFGLSGGLPIWLSIVLALAVVCLVGAINGLITVMLNVPSFVTTLAMNFILYGVVLVGSQDASASPIPLSRPVGLHRQRDGQRAMGRDHLGARRHADTRLPAHADAFRHAHHRHGRQPARRGRGRRADPSRQGVGVRDLRVLRRPDRDRRRRQVRNARPRQRGVAYILYAVGACVIGGTALTGGRGTVIGAFIGAVLLGVLQDGLTVIGVSTNAFYIWVGIVILFAMALNVQFDRLIARSRAR